MKASGLKPPMKIERPCSSTQPRPAVPPSPQKPSMNSMEHLWETHGRRLSEAGLRRGSDNSVILTEDTDSFIIGDRVWVGGTKPGQIAYIGETQFAPGDWAGIVLDEPIGKNDGSVAGCRYFQCEPKRGIFSRLTRLTRYPLSNADSSSPVGPKTPTTSPSESKRGSLNKSISPSLNTSTTSLASISHKELRIGDRVIISSSQGSKTGVLRYLGTTEFAPGEWCGVELDEPVGKNNGSVGEKRYFECRPKYGLFAPLHKVSRSPSNKSKMCMIHRPTGAALSASLKKAGSRDSLASVSSIGSTATSIAAKTTTSTTRKPVLRTSTSARNLMQDMLKEKQQEIEVLRKERDLERERFTKAANQADKAEQSLTVQKKEYEKYREENDKAAQETQTILAKLLEEKELLGAQLEEEKRKCEDLLFRFEEESVNKDDIQVVNTVNENRIKELEKQLSEERERVIQLERDSTKLFETEEELTRLRTELQVVTNQDKDKLKGIESHYKILEESNLALKKEMKIKNETIEKYVQHITELQESVSKKIEESSTHKELELSFQKAAEEAKKLLEEKCALFDIMKKEHEIESENWRKEMLQLQESAEKQKEQEKKDMMLECQKQIQEKVNVVKTGAEKLKAEAIKNAVSYTENVEKLKNESVEKIKQITMEFEEQLCKKDEEVKSFNELLERKNADFDKLTKEFSEVQSTYEAKDKSDKEALDKIEELNQKLKLFEKRCSLLLDEEEAVRCEIESELKKFYIENQNLNDHHLDPVSQAEMVAEKEKIELTKLQNAKTEQFEALKEKFKSRCRNNLKLIKYIITIIARKDARLETLEKNVIELKTIAMNKDGEITILLEKNTELQDTVKLSEETKTNLESELRMHEMNLEDLNRKLLRAEEKIAEYMDEKQKFELNATNAMSASTDLSNQLKKYNEDLRKNEKELDDARDKEFQLQKLLETTEGKFRKTEVDLSKSNSALQQLESEKSELKSQFDTLEKELAKLSDEHKTKEQKFQKLSEEAEQKLNKSIEDMEMKNQNFEKLKTENTKLTTEIDDLKKDIERLVKDCDDKKQQLLQNAQEFDERTIKMEEYFKLEIKKIQAQLDAEKKEFEKLSNEKQSVEESQNKLLIELEEMRKSTIQKDSEILEVNKIVNSVKKEKDSLKIEVCDLQEKLKSGNEDKCDLKKEKSIFEEELSSVKKVLSEREEIVNKLETEIGEINKKFEAKVKMLEDSVQKQNGDLSNRDSEIEELRVKVATVEKKLQVEYDKNEELRKKESLIEDIRKENNNLVQTRGSLEKLVKEYEEKLDQISSARKIKETEAQELIEKINSLSEQNVKLKESHSILEKENKQLSIKCVESVESLKLTQENMKNNANNEGILNNTVLQVTGDGIHNVDTQLKNVKEENESFKMQIDFLNSVIVDMQRKNEKLQCKVEVLEIGVPANEADDYNRATLEKRLAPPRMFCDICDQFDLHETEDCHRQDQDFLEPEKLPASKKKIPIQRPYCENCEEFGHDTNDCNDAETF